MAAKMKKNNDHLYHLDWKIQYSHVVHYAFEMHWPKKCECCGVSMRDNDKKFGAIPFKFHICHRGNKKIPDKCDYIVCDDCGYELPANDIFGAMRDIVRRNRG